MGKVKKHRQNKSKKSPLDVNSTEESDQLTNPNDILVGLKSLQGSVREGTCVALASIFGDSFAQDKNKQQMLKKLLDNGGIKKIFPRIVDPVQGVRVHAIGALKNISITGGLDVCEYMVIEGVITPLEKVIEDNASALVKYEQEEGKRSWDILEQAFSLLANVCESSQLAVNQISSSSSILKYALLALKEELRQPSIQLEACKLLLVVTDGNDGLCSSFEENPANVELLANCIKSNETPMMSRLNCVGVMLNLNSIRQSNSSLSVLVRVLEESLSFNDVNVVQFAKAASDASEYADGNDNTDFEVIDNKEAENQLKDIQTRRSEAKNVMKKWQDCVQILKFGLELIANFCASQDADGDDFEWESDDEEKMEEEAMNITSQDSSPDSASFKVIAESNVFNLIRLILKGLISIPPGIKEIVGNDFSILRSRTCNSLANLIPILPVHNDIENFLRGVFQDLCSLYQNVQNEKCANNSFQVSSRDTVDDVEAALTSAMCTTLQRSLDKETNMLPSHDQINLVMSCATTSLSVDARRNSVGVIGFVGRITNDASANKVVAEFLLKSLSDPTFEVVTEALDAIFDIYGQDDFNSIFKDLNMIKALEETSSSMKSRIHSEGKKMDRDLLAHSKETRLNLVRFIKYKKKNL